MTKGIYCYIDNKDDKVVYVGKDSNIDNNNRHRAHLAPSKYNKQPINRILQKNPDRYNYRILWKISDCTDNHLNQMEKYYIRKYDPKFNFTEGGDGISGFEHSEETRKKMSEATKGKNNPNYGKTLSKETKRKISEARKGKKHSEKTKRKMSEAKKGKKSPTYGKTLSEETRKKMSEAKNATGFYRVYKNKKKDVKQGFIWRYGYYENGRQKTFSSTNLMKLKRKVVNAGLEWKIVDERKAQQSILSQGDKS